MDKTPRIAHVGTLPIIVGLQQFHQSSLLEVEKWNVRLSSLAWYQSVSCWPGLLQLWYYSVVDDYCTFICVFSIAPGTLVHLRMEGLVLILRRTDNTLLLTKCLAYCLFVPRSALRSLVCTRYLRIIKFSAKTIPVFKGVWAITQNNKDQNKATV